MHILMNCLKPVSIAKEDDKTASLPDTGMVRIGNMSPVFKISKIPNKLNDTGKHRVGNMSPVFRL